MKRAIAVLSLAAACSTVSALAQDDDFAKGPIKRVLLISVDGMHAVDLLTARMASAPSTMAIPTARRSLLCARPA